MQSRWGDSEAREFVSSLRGRGRGACAARVQLAPDRRRARPGAARRRQHFGEVARRDLYGEEIDVLHIKGSGLGSGVDRAGGTSRRCASTTLVAAARAGRARSDEMMVAELRRALLDPARTQPVGRDPAARVSSPLLHRPLARRRDSGAHKSAGRRGARARAVRGTRGVGAVRHAGLRSSPSLASRDLRQGDRGGGTGAREARAVHASARPPA